MSSAAKTLDLLTYFSPNRAEIGLSQMCRLAHRDKATTYRHLQALEEAGFVEQNILTKLYRLGPALLQLAQMRELTVPRKTGAEVALEPLVDATGETAHVTVLSGKTIYSLAARESHRHSTRAIVDIQTFALHATASGLCALAFGPDYLFNEAVANMEAFTKNTVTTSAELEETVQRVRQTGFGQANRSFEKDVEGISAPLFDSTGRFAGAVSVACVAARFTPALEHVVQENLVIASRKISRSWGGTPTPEIESVWAKSLAHDYVLEKAS